MAGVGNIINGILAGGVSLPGVTVQGVLNNPDNTNAASNASLLIQTGGASSGDCLVNYEVTGATEWSTGIDNSASDSFKISGSDSLGTNDYLTITTAGQPAFPSMVGIAFTPTLAFGGASTGITYSAQAGLYYQFGNLVFYRVNINLSSKGTAVGNATIGGMPVAAGVNGNLNSALGYFQNITLTANYTNVNAINATSSTNLSLMQQGSGQTIVAVNDTHFTNTSLIYISSFYFTDS